MTGRRGEGAEGIIEQGFRENEGRGRERERVEEKRGKRDKSKRRRPARPGQER
jgi:hypothetical protein